MSLRLLCVVARVDDLSTTPFPQVQLAFFQVQVDVQALLCGFKVVFETLGKTCQRDNELGMLGQLNL